MTVNEETISAFRETIGLVHRDAHERGVLAMWTIYHRPTDHPESYVARVHEVDKGKTYATRNYIETRATELGLEILRAVFLDAGLTCIARSPQDEPQIVETWL